MLACAQKELEKEKSLRITVESQRDAIVKEIESLVCKKHDIYYIYMYIYIDFIRICCQNIRKNLWRTKMT